jgi:transcription initiation factor TFIID subunit 1
MHSQNVLVVGGFGASEYLFQQIKLHVPQLPKPKILTLDPNDENIILGIPDDVDPQKQRADNAIPTKVKIPHPHVKKSKLLLGKAGVINVLQEDAPPPPSKSPDHDPFNISNDR